ncbi:MAG: polyprenyl synthetase family protein [Ignavibacteriota bacterium]|nr:polyprenyl synthetase family protein [Ignavibacteriales bacterium]MBL1124423.1 polyprenyl synthetase family protein [Ignavibacteriota bacterium]MCC7094310.1 polyprenyl synthetase family protein [Ignavibacteriaceae bacterium]MCE7857324.1 polyprenyl synthetase family protein [Ignavibacteria bacterium CHB3]NUM61426.1 polyprenyl synthetase family protein [Ignavibacteriaceae bacterium]
MFNNQLSEITQPIKNELDSFNEIFRESLRSNVGLVDLVARYIIRQKGKKIRPLLVLLSAKVCGGINERSYRGAVLVELLHTATLVHDDVVDHADKRRGLWSINKVFKNKVAVLMGDYLLSKGLLIAMEGKDFDFLEVITNTVKRMSEGELLQIQKTRKLDIDEETYFKVISDKTASLIETCCTIGAMSSSSDTSFVNAMSEFGKNLGMSFQIRDDILDYEGSLSVFGKRTGGDIKEKKITLPLIHSLKQVPANKAADIRKIIKNGKDKPNIDEVINFVRENKGIEYAIGKAHIYSQAAKDALKKLPDSQSKLALEALVDFAIDRKN